METLQAKRVLVTGGSRGLGRGMVEAMLDAGARVHTIARDASALAALQVELGAGLRPVPSRTGWA